MREWWANASSQSARPSFHQTRSADASSSASCTNGRAASIASTQRPAGARHVAPVETRALREVALEVGRVQVDALDHAAPAEPQHDPIVAGAPAAPRLPAVAHVACWPRHDQVQRLAEELIARGERRAAVLPLDQADPPPPPRPRPPPPVPARLAPAAQASPTAARLDL